MYLLKNTNRLKIEILTRFKFRREKGVLPFSILPFSRKRFKRFLPSIGKNFFCWVINVGIFNAIAYSTVLHFYVIFTILTV